MRFKVISKGEREIKAVVGVCGKGLFIRHRNGLKYLDASGITDAVEKNLADIGSRSGRTPVYEGDEVVITF